MQVAHKPSGGNIPHDVFDRCERKIGIRFVVHGQDNAGDNLQHQHHQ